MRPATRAEPGVRSSQLISPSPLPSLFSSFSSSLLEQLSPITLAPSWPKTTFTVSRRPSELCEFYPNQLEHETGSQPLALIKVSVLF